MSAPISSTSTTPSTTSSTPTTSSTTPGVVAGSAPSSALFTIAGLATGLDTNSIISKLLAVYTAPETQIQREQAVVQQKQAAWNDIGSKLNALQTAIQNLQAPSASAGKVATATPPSAGTASVSITTSPSAAAGTYAVNVQNLATTGTLSGGANMSALITGAQSTTAGVTTLNLGVPATTGTFTVNGSAITVDSTTTMLGAVGDTLQAKLATAGVTMTGVTDGSGNVIGVTLHSAIPLQLGAPGDTSNMLTALRLNTAAPTAGGTNITSNGSLSGSALNTTLSSLKLATALTTTTGSFTVNGVAITYGSADTLGSIIGRINQSNAGVTASYDGLSDRMMINANTTGTGGIAVADVGGGNLAAAFKMTTGAGAVVTPGAPAVFTISGFNGGNPIASATNTVANVVPGMTINLLAASPSMLPAGATTVTVAGDSTALTTALQGFVTAYNAVQDTITKYTAINTDSTGAVQNAGLLTGDPSLSNLTSQLDQAVNGTAVSINGKQFSMASLGISTGAAGGFGSTSSVPSLDLEFTTSKLTSALASSPSLAQSFIGNGTVTSQQGTLFQSLNNLVNTWTAPLGNLGTTQDALTADYANEQQQIQQWQDYATAEQQQLSNTFTAMETAVSLIQAQGQALNAALGNSTNSSSSNSNSSSTGH